MNFSSGEIKCAKCWSLNPKGNNFCGKCGERLHTKCRRCGHLNERGHADCSECGSRLRQSFWRHWRRKLFKSRDYDRGDKLMLIFMVIVLSLLMAWVAHHMSGFQHMPVVNE